ncbi:unnamed protein product, partial [Polarella glacialis]
MFLRFIILGSLSLTCAFDPTCWFGNFDLLSCCSGLKLDCWDSDFTLQRCCKGAGFGDTKCWHEGRTWASCCSGARSDCWQPEPSDLNFATCCGQ